MAAGQPFEADDGGPLHPLRVPRLLGHGAAEQALLDAYRSGRLHHAWLLGGPEGIGKATLAWHFAHFILSNPDPASAAVQTATGLGGGADPAATQRLLAGSHADLAVLERQWNDKTKKLYTEIRVDDVRDALGIFQRASASGGYRICIIDSAEDLNRSSANALLKMIEEPPPRSLFLIVAHRPGQVLPTLVSRARRLLLPALAEAEIGAAVRALGGDWATVDEARLLAVAARARGSVGEALRLLSEQALDLDEAVTALLARLPDIDWRRVHRVADLVGMSDERMAIVLRSVYDWLEHRVHAGARAQLSPRQLMRLADSWQSIRAGAQEADVLNLDKRPVLLTAFADLARASSPR